MASSDRRSTLDTGILVFSRLSRAVGVEPGDRLLLLLPVLGTIKMLGALLGLFQSVVPADILVFAVY